MLSPSSFVASPPLTGASKGFKVSSLPFCPSPEEVEVPVVPEGGAVSVFYPPFSGVLVGSVVSLLLVPLPLDEPSDCSAAGALFVC